MQVLVTLPDKVGAGQVITVQVGLVPLRTPLDWQVWLVEVPLYPVAHEARQIPPVVMLVQLDCSWEPVGKLSVHLLGTHFGKEPLSAKLAVVEFQRHCHDSAVLFAAML